MSMALVMSQMPDVWRKVLAEHVPDQAGRCRECRDSAGQTASWPCQTYRVAQEAKWVSEGNLPGTGPHGPGPSASPRLSPPDSPLSGRFVAPTAGSYGDPRDAAPYGSPGAYASDSYAFDTGSSYGSTGDRGSRSYGLDTGGHSRLDDALSRPSWRADSWEAAGSSFGGYDSSAPEPSYRTDHRDEYRPEYRDEPRRGRHGSPDDGSPYGSRVDAPYGASFGVDDRRRPDRR